MGDSVIKKRKLQTKKSIYSRSLQFIASADDVVILARVKKELKEALREFSRGSRLRNKLQQNKIYGFGNASEKGHNENIMKLEKIGIERVESIGYLGAFFMRMDEIRAKHDKG